MRHPGDQIIQISVANLKSCFRQAFPGQSALTLASNWSKFWARASRKGRLSDTEEIPSEARTSVVSKEDV